jgi:hypothetical protein
MYRDNEKKKENFIELKDLYIYQHILGKKREKNVTRESFRKYTVYIMIYYL